MDFQRTRRQWGLRRVCSRSEQRSREHPRGRRRFCCHRGSSRRLRLRLVGKQGGAWRQARLDVELLDAEVVVVDKALEGFFAILHRAHFDAATHTVEGHRDHGVAGLPTDGAVFGVIGD